MRLPADPRFIAEIERFGLRFTCGACLHYLRSVDACAHAWPTDEHKELPRPGGLVVFCKEFEVL